MDRGDEDRIGEWTKGIGTSSMPDQNRVVGHIITILHPF